jgi:hypothetical protein
MKRNGAGELAGMGCPDNSDGKIDFSSPKGPESGEKVMERLG